MPTVMSTGLPITEGLAKSGLVQVPAPGADNGLQRGLCKARDRLTLQGAMKRAFRYGITQGRIARLHLFQVRCAAGIGGSGSNSGKV
jgi:hypothetical protein